MNLNLERFLFFSLNALEPFAQDNQNPEKNQTNNGSRKTKRRSEELVTLLKEY